MEMVKTVFVTIIVLFLITVFSLVPVYVYENYFVFTTLSAVDTVQNFVALCAAINSLAGNILFNAFPFVNGFIEHFFDLNIHYGPCRVKNITSNGLIVIGLTDAGDGKQERHMRSYTEDFKEVEKLRPLI